MANRVSPDTVVVDLTADDDDPKEERCKELDGLRVGYSKRAKRKANDDADALHVQVVCAVSNDRAKELLEAASGDVNRAVSIHLDDKDKDDPMEEEEEDRISRLYAELTARVKKKQRQKYSSRARVSRRDLAKKDTGTLELSYKDDHDEIFKAAGSKEEAKVKKEGKPMARQPRRVSYYSADSSDDDDEEKEVDADVCVVAAPAKKISAAAASAKEDDDADDDIELVGTANETKLPHMRQHCTECPFEEGSDSNHKHCSLCYCFVCDEPVEDCSQWKEHCHASDTGPRRHYWQKQRQDHKEANKTPPSTPPRRNPAAAAPPRVARPAPAPANNREQARAFAPFAGPVSNATNRSARLKGGLIVKAGPGPFKPNDEVAQKDPNLTGCRKCGYYNRFFHRNFQPQHYRNLHPVGFLDCCHHCGLIASDQDFGKEQSKPFKPLPEDVYLGQKVIPFTIFARDPREIKSFKKNWTKSNLDYNEGQLQHDVFCHRLGARPTLKMILASVPVVNTVNIKKAATSLEPVKIRYEKYYASNAAQEENKTYQRLCCPSGDKFSYWRPAKEGSNNAASLDETEGIQLENPATDLVILAELHQFDSQGMANENRGTNKVVLGYNITAKWDKESQKGQFILKLHVRPNKISASKDFGSFGKLLGAWYGVFPFKLADIGSTLKATACNNSADHTIVNSTLPPSRITKAKAKINAKQKQAVEEHNLVVDLQTQEHTLASSSVSEAMGGTCPLALGFENVLKRFFSEVLVDDVTKGRVNSKRWIDEPLGYVSGHRRKAKTGVALKDVSMYENDCVHELNYLQKEDLNVAVVNTRQHCRTIWKGTKSLKGIIEHAENLGHAKIPFVEGLTVELLQFQKESVQWCYERETMEGGVQSMLWPKLPKVAQHDKELWFNPVLESVRSDKPKLVRGGIIGEEMGLGKTIISLALILVNPAPKLPKSGTLTKNLESFKDTTWDKDLYDKSKNPLRGKVISHGTLVVCKVSLVGQWIAEAKSKLKDPGLVYSYHGSSRKRDPKVLAMNAIVVTTYETLKSDDNYFREKAKDPSKYCPPLEQIRWWRIICDESHEMKNPDSLTTKAVIKLHSDHRWLVSGTPMVSSILDLKNQMEFLGIEHVDEIFLKFSKLLAHTKDPYARQKRDPNGRVLGHFMFLIRHLLMRHSQKQTYNGTDTTLMSLPPKTERVVEVEFDDEERLEYDELQGKALEFYCVIRERCLNSSGKAQKKLGSQVLKLKRKLEPLQVACAGGPYPLKDFSDSPVGKDEDDEDDEDEDGDKKMRDVEAEESEEDDEEEEEETNGKKKKAKPPPVQYSDFAFSSKVKRLIQELKEARDKDETSKSLVFSEYASSLKYLQEELPKHGFQYRTLSGDMSMKKRAKALDDFQNDPPTTIFLLSMRAAAVGINLTQANRIFLLEPSFKTAMVKQAIGRVYRLGQKREVEIIRLILKDTVESRIAKLLKNEYGEGDGVATGEDIDDDVVLQADKTESLTEKFDLLFGYKGPKAAAVKPEPKEAKKETNKPRSQARARYIARVKKEAVINVDSGDSESESDSDREI